MVTCSPPGPNGIVFSPRSHSVERLVAADETIGADTDEDGLEVIQHLVGPGGLLGNARVQPDEGILLSRQQTITSDVVRDAPGRACTASRES